MPTYREDLHLGHAVPTTDTADIVNGAITEEKMANDSVSTRTIQDLAVTEPKLADDAVSTRTIQNLAVTEPKLADNSVSTRTIQNGAVTFAKLNNDVTRVLGDLQNQINGFYEHGVAVSNFFGENTNIGISQKTLTYAINRIYDLLEEALDRTLKEFTWEVTPIYVYGQEPTAVTVTALPVEEGGILEHVELWVDGEIIEDATAEGVTSYAYTFETNKTVDVTLKAQVLGIPYERSQRVTHYDSFWMGGGSSYSSIYNHTDKVVDVSNGMRTSKNISVESGQYIFIVLGNYLKDAFVRADINGVEIPFQAADTTTLEGFTIYKSENTYSAGTYNIDING